MTVPQFQMGEEFAAAMDARDPLAHFRSRFFVQKQKLGMTAFICAGTRSGCSRKLQAHMLSRSCVTGRNWG